MTILATVLFATVSMKSRRCVSGNHPAVATKVAQLSNVTTDFLVVYTQSNEYLAKSL